MKIGTTKFVILALAMGLLTSCADPIQERKNLMRSNIGNMKAIGAFLKTGKGSAGDVASRARTIAGNAEKISGLFPAGTSLKDKPGQTRAKPSIWAKKSIHNQAEDKAAFNNAADIMSVYALKLASAADSGDKKAIGAAMGQLGKNGCGGCHKFFRGPKPKK